MSVYYGHSIQHLESQEKDNSVYTLMKWHPSYTLLATGLHSVSNGNGSVQICHDEGEIIDDLILQHPLPVEQIDWHPEKKILACGWQNGMLTFSNVATSESYDHRQGHISPIATLSWSNRGGHLLSSDRTGIVLVWRLDSNGQLHPTPVHHNQLSGAPTHCVVTGQVPEWSRFSADSPRPDSITAYFAIENGGIYFMTGKGQCVEMEKVDGRLRQLRFTAETSILAGITDKLTLVVFSVNVRGVVSRVIEAKISGQGLVRSAVWSPEGILATCSQEMNIRFWDCHNSEHYMLNLKEQLNCYDDCVVTDVDYSLKNDMLATSTDNGLVALWKRESVPSGDNWKHVTTFNTENKIESIAWSGSKNLLAINMINSVRILSRYDAVAAHCEGISAVQVSPGEVTLQVHSSNSMFTVRNDLPILSGITLNREHLVVWNKERVVVYSILPDKSTSRQIATFSSESCYAALYELNVYTIDDNHLIARNVQGVVKHKLPVGGEPGNTVTSLHVSGCHLVLVTELGHVRVWDVSRREPKLTYEKNLSQFVPDYKTAVYARSNANASRIAVLVKLKEIKQLLLVVISPSKDTIKWLDFSNMASLDLLQSDDCTDTFTVPSGVSSTVKEEQALLADQLSHANILRCHWDAVDKRLLVLEFQRDMRLRRTNSRRHSKVEPEMILLTVFITDNMEILLQGMSGIDSKFNRSLACDVPCVYYLNEKLLQPSLDSSTASDAADASSVLVKREPLKDFVGLIDCDSSTINAIMSFSYFSAIGNMDEAFKSIKTVKSHTVWENLAKMCVKSQRLDVALVCLGHMGNAMAAMAVREAQSIPEADARLAVLAAQLGMLDEAENLYKQSGRYDLLNEFYQSCDKWEKAIEVAEINDRMNLQTTYFNYGKHSEALGEIKPALRCYERAEAPFEIMRMLNDDPVELEEYVMSSKDSDVRHYWAEYLESIEDLEGAVLEYESCGDIHSQVRVLNLLGDIKRAVEVVEETRDKAAAYFMALQLSHSSELSDVQRALQFFTLACCFHPAIQLAKDNGLDVEMMNLALMSGREDKVEVAKYYEAIPDLQDKAIMLYHKAGELSKALDLCFQHRHFEVLHVIAEELSDHSNPDTLRKVAEYFVEQKQFDKAVDLLLRTNRVSEALELCATHHVIINEDLAEKMTPVRRDEESPEENKERIKLLQDLGDCLVDQGQWHLAAKKFTQSGDRIKAMKALLKSGDTEKITYFANVSRQKEIYILSANYLQSLDWKGNPKIMKNIIGFYTKGRALESLANFYDTCAQVEIDEYQDYGKAYGALNEAVKCLRKASSKSKNSLEEKIAFFEYRSELIKRFSDARNAYSDSPEQCVQECLELLSDPRIDTAVRSGDIFGLLITHYTQHQQFQEAYDMIEEIKRRIPGVNPEFFVDSSIIAAVYEAMGLEMGNPSVSTDKIEGNDSDDEVEEEFDGD